jgi:hypothetical protein
MSANNNGGDGVQQSGPSVITSPTNDTRTFNHRGTEVGEDNVELSQNTTGSHTEILRWTIPDKFQRAVIAGGKHYTKAHLRSKETVSGDGATTTFSLTGDIVPTGGETTPGDQPEPTVVAYDTDASAELDIESYDFDANEVTFASAPNDATDNVEMWPLVTEGIFQFRADDAFGQQVGPLNEYGVPLHVFPDSDQSKSSMQIYVPGAGRWTENEAIVVYVDSPRQIVWEDENYPQGQYVSTLEQRVDVQV